MAIVRKEAYFNSSTGKNKIRTLIWADDEVQPKAVFQMAHGVSEHIGRYDDFARFLAGNGFVVCGNDHLGHGKSVNSIDDLGYVDEKDGHIRWVDDMHILTNIMKKRYPGLPYFLFGHSMGSFCARVYASLFGNELSGAIFCGTGELPATMGLLKKPLEKITEIFGAHSKADAVAESLNVISNLQFRNARTKCDWLSDNEENVDNYINDPLCGFNFKLGGSRDVALIAMQASAADWAKKVPQNLPVMLVSGAKDSIGMNGKGVLAVADNLELAGNEPTVIIYPNDRHEILNEKDHDKIYNDILKWLNSVLEG